MQASALATVSKAFSKARDTPMFVCFTPSTGLAEALLCGIVFCIRAGDLAPTAGESKAHEDRAVP